MKTTRKMFPLSCAAIILAIIVTITVTAVASHTALGEREEGRPLSIVVATEDMAGHALPLLALGETLTDRGHNVSVVEVEMGIGGKKLISDMCAERKLPLYTYEAATAKDFDLTKVTNGIGISFFLNTMLPMIVESQDTMIKALATEHLANTDVVVLDMFFPAVAHWLNRNTNVTVITFTQNKPTAFATLPSWHYPNMLGGGSDPTLKNRLITTAAPVLLEIVVNTVGYRYKNYLAVYTPAGVYNPEIVGVGFGFDYPRPFYPMMHFVGPVMSRNEQVLPDDLRVWLDRHSPRSVLFVSMGSMFTASKQLAISVVDAAVQSNSHILWAMKDSNRHVFDDVDPELLHNGNIFISSWLPQAAVLRHPSISVAILHCGLGGVNEALMGGVPIIGFPIAVDQFGNCARVHDQGLGVCLHGAGNITSDLLQCSIKEIERGSYRETIRKLNIIFKEAGGVERAADLIEHYHKVGYDHLVPFWAKHQWSTVQYYNLDVYAVIAGVLVLVVFALYKCTRCVGRRMCSRQHSTVKTKKD